MATCKLLGQAHLGKEEYDEAKVYINKLLATAQESGDKEAERSAYMFLREAHLKKEEYDDAISCSKKVLQITQESGEKKEEMAEAYFHLVIDHLKMKEYDDAISYGEKCLPIAQECGDTKSEMATCKLLGKAHLDKEEYDEAKLYNNKLLAMAQESGHKEAEMSAYMMLRDAHLKKEECDDAISCSKKIIQIAQESGDKKEEMADAYFHLVIAHFKKKEYVAAISYGEKCLPIAQECGDTMSVMAAYKLLGQAHLEKEEYDDTKLYMNKCLAMAQESGHNEAESGSYVMLGEAHARNEEYDDAISYGKKCLSIARRCGDAMSEMAAYKLLGKSHMKKEEYDEAKSYIKKLLAMAQECGNKVEEMEANGVLGDASWKNNAYDDAYSCFTEGKKIAMDLQDDSRKSAFESYLMMTYEEVGIETSNKLGVDILQFSEVARFNEGGDEIKWVFLYLQYVVHKQNEEWKEAIAKLEEAEAILAATQPTNDSIRSCKKRWLCKHGISEMHAKLEQHDEAMKYQQEAIAVAVTRSQQATSHFSLGKIYYKRQELENAKQSLEESLKYYELIFKDLKQNDRFKIAFVNKYKEAFKMLLKVLIETNKKEEALVLSDRYRAKALRDLLVSSYGMEEDPVAEDDLKYADVQSLVSSRNYSLLLYSSCDEKLCTFLLQAGKELEFSVEHFENCDTCLEDLVDKAFDEMKVRQVVNCENRSLDVVDDFEENKNPKEDELTRMLTRQKEERLTEQCNSICGCRGEPSENTDESSLTSGLEILYRKLIQNIKRLVKEDEIVIIPEGPLYKVPFAALWDPDKGQYLSETKRIRMAPSMATLKLLQEYPEEQYLRKEALVIGDPLVGCVIMAGKEEYIKPLEGALNEAKHVGHVLGVQPLLEANATKAAVIKRLREGASIVHIAAQGDLEKATILLAPTSESRENEKIPDEEDYMLTMADVQQTQVRAQLVVLSYCHSGRGEIKAEGVVGMCRAFLASGARAVMGSLWAVDDEATRMFMETFYNHLKDGKSASTSLHLTMNDMRKTPEYSEPKYWAPFFLKGDDVTINFED